MSLHNKVVMVTGGCGFIGSHLIDRIVKENPERTIVVDNMFLGNTSNISWHLNGDYIHLYEKDASDIDEMKLMFEEENVDVVFNLAVIPLPASLTKPEWTFTHTNAITSTMCECAREGLYKTLIHFSSSETYGTSLYGDPMNETHPLNGLTPYAAAKIACDALVFSYYRTFGVDASIIRPFNNYGPRQNMGSYAGVIPITINNILKGMPPVLHGDGSHTRDYLYVKDTANAAISIYNHTNTRGKVLNIASGRKISILSLIEIIAGMMGYTGKLFMDVERPGDVKCHIADISLAKDLIDFTPSVSFEEGIKMTIEWYNKHKSTRKI